MAGRKKENFERARVEFMAEPAWIRRITEEAARIGLSLSAFIRMAVTQAADAAEAVRNAQPPKRKDRHP